MPRWELPCRDNPIAIPHRRLFSISLACSRRPVLPKNEDLLLTLNRVTGVQNHETPAPGDPLETDGEALENREPVLQGLPQSPLTDVKLNAARLARRRTKPSKAELSPFQVELRKNPYARLLASSLRQCRLTSARLPKDLLLQFRLGTHPKTGEHWHLPSLAATPFLRHEKEKPVDAENSLPESSTKSATHNVSEKHGQNSRTLSGQYFILSHRALSHISSLSENRLRSLVPFRWKNTKGINTKSLIWREDMADFTLALLRKQTIAQIQAVLGNTEGPYVVPVDQPSSIEERKDVSAILVSSVGAPWQESSHDGRQESHGDDNRDPCLYQIVQHISGRVPAYFLRTLLGDKDVESLRATFPETMGKDSTILVKDKVTVELQTHLWRLVGYLS